MSTRRRAGKRAGEGAVALAAAALLVAHVWAFAGALAPSGLPATALGMLAGLLILDAMSGLVHWACDTWGDERTPWFGPGLVRSFREHHRDPRAMLSHHWLEVNRETAGATAAVLLLLWLPGPHAWIVDRPFAAGLVYALAGVGALANQLHYWAHADRVPVPVRSLQRWGLILSPEHHRHHHRAPQLSGYCIATGWLNPLLDRTGAWRTLEGWISRLGIAEPRAGGAETRRRGPPDSPAR